MKIGDLVFHIDDIELYPDPAPGLVMDVFFVGEQEEAKVHFYDRTFAEHHKLDNLIKVEDCKENSNANRRLSKTQD